MTYDTIFDNPNHETRTLMTSMRNPDGDEILGTKSCLMSQLAMRYVYSDISGGTHLSVEIHLKASRVNYWLDSFLYLRDLKRRVSILADMLNEHLGKSI